MIGVREAIDIVKNNSILLEKKEVELLDSLSHCLAEDIFAPISMPPFSQSAMDGYAICGDLNSFKVVGEVQAGNTNIFQLKNGEAYRIFTGAMIPQGTTSIAKQEIVERTIDDITLLEPVKVGTSIRIAGEEIEKGALVMKKGTLINGAAVGLLSSFGIQKVNVYSKPKITVVVTGNELTPLGDNLDLGRIYESNSYTLRSVLKSLGYAAEIKKVKDNFEDTKNMLAMAIDTSDMLIVTGGISVGDYDFVGKALNEIGVEQKFYKVNQKPGKPIFYGVKDKVKVFALPGNPAAVLTCFYIYVLPSLRKMMGYKKPLLEERNVFLCHDFTRKGTRSVLLKAKTINGEVEVHAGQSSAMLSSFVDANCLLFIDSDQSMIEKGSSVTVFMLP